MAVATRLAEAFRLRGTPKRRFDATAAGVARVGVAKARPRSAVIDRGYSTPTSSYPPVTVAPRTP